MIWIIFSCRLIRCIHLVWITVCYFSWYTSNLNFLVFLCSQPSSVHKQQNRNLVSLLLFYFLFAFSSYWSQSLIVIDHSICAFVNVLHVVLVLRWSRRGVSLRREEEVWTPQDLGKAALCPGQYLIQVVIKQKNSVTALSDILGLAREGGLVNKLTKYLNV